MNPPVAIPLTHSRDILFEKVAVVAHIFYPDVLPQILEQLKNVPVPSGLFISTDTEEKGERIAAAIQASGLMPVETKIEITPNRGRDIAPKIIAFKDVYKRYLWPSCICTRRSRYMPAANIKIGEDIFLKG